MLKTVRKLKRQWQKEQPPWLQQNIKSVLKKGKKKASVMDKTNWRFFFPPGMQKEMGKHENGINRRAGQGARYSRRNENKSQNRKETINKDFWGGGELSSAQRRHTGRSCTAPGKMGFQSPATSWHPLTTHLHSNERIKPYNPLSGRRRRRRVSPVKQHK